MFMRNYLENLKRAIDKGAPVKGYFAWSLLDNFEWESGYTLRFGLVYVDFATQKRSMKLSAHYYKDLIRRNGAS
jgi:beta-glucosidase